MFDLNVYPYPVSERLTAPGFLVFPPKEKTARGRENNLLIVYFSLMGRTSITAEGLRTWMEQKAEGFHKNAGTVTAGIREFIESINSDLYDRNVRPDRKDTQVVMNLQVAVLKKDMVYLANCGNGQSFLVGDDGVLTFRDIENTSRGLGLSQSISIRFSQSVVSANDLLIMSFNPSASWTPDLLSGGQSISIDAFARRIFAGNDTPGRGVLIRFTEGAGKISCLRLNQGGVSAVVEGKKEEVLPTQPIITPVPDRSDAQWVPAVESTKDSPEPEAPAQAEEKIGPGSQPQPVETGGIQLRRITRPTAHGNPRAEQSRTENTESSYSTEMPEQPYSRQVSQELPLRPHAPESSQQEESPAISLIQTEAVKAVVGKTLRKGAEVKNQTGEFVKDIAQKVLPGEPEKPIKISKALLIIIAIVVPIIVVAIALTVYSHNGKNAEISLHLGQAQQYVDISNTQISDTPARIASLQAALAELDKADELGTSPDSTNMRTTIQSVLDALQGIIRVDMSSALSDISLPGVNFTQLAATSTDLYALDSISGKVMRFSLNGSSYVQDTSFDCGPNPQNPLNVIGNLVDMSPIPVNNSYGATIMAIDSAGKLDYCVPGDTGYVVSLEPPDMGWGTIQSMTLFEGNLYILDTKGNAVYRYEGNGTDFKDKPTLFFDEVIPQITSALDIEEQGYELYILRSSGDMVECTYSPLKDMKSTECEEPATFLDARTDQDIETSSFAGTQFTQLHLTDAPDSSLYILDAANNQVYHFSYIRSLQRVLTPRISDGSDSKKLYPTAFTVSPTRMLFIAYSNQIYFGQIP